MVEAKSGPGATDAPVLVQRQDYWARLTINRPRVSNAADMATWQVIGDEVANRLVGRAQREPWQL